jgi:hypothetical protein
VRSPSTPLQEKELTVAEYPESHAHGWIYRDGHVEKLRTALEKKGRVSSGR